MLRREMTPCANGDEWRRARCQRVRAEYPPGEEHAGRGTRALDLTPHLARNFVDACARAVACVPV